VVRNKEQQKNSKPSHINNLSIIILHNVINITIQVYAMVYG